MMDGMFEASGLADGFVDVGALDAIPRRGARTVRVPEGEVAIFRCLDDHVFALDDRCPHKDGKLSQGIVHGHSVTCPLHGLVLSLVSGTADPKEEGCARRHAVRVENGRILLGPALD